VGAVLDHLRFKIRASMRLHRCSNGWKELREVVSITDAEDHRQRDRIGVFRVEFFIRRECPIKFECCPQMIWIAVCIRVASHVGVAEEFLPEEISEIVHLSPGDQFLR
jgi:hypothetical protein